MNSGTAKRSLVDFGRLELHPALKSWHGRQRNMDFLKFAWSYLGISLILGSWEHHCDQMLQVLTREFVWYILVWVIQHIAEHPPFADD